MNFTEQIVEIIIDIFNRDVRLKPEDLEFLESVTGCFGTQALFQALNEPLAESRLTILELALFPDLGSRARMEGVLSHEGLDPSQVESLIQAILERKPTIRLVIDSHLKPIDISMDHESLSTYISRLHLDRLVPNNLAEALAWISDQPSADMAAAALRASGLAWTEGQEEVVGKVVETNHFKDDFLSFLEKVLILLGEVPEDRHPEEYLEEKRDWCLFHLDKARAEEQELAGKNMETRILSGIRTSYADKNRLHTQIALIDRILYGMPPLPGM